MKKNYLTYENSFLRICKGYSRIFQSKWFLFLLLFVFAAGCKKVIEETGLVGICPTVILTSPLDTASSIGLSKRIDATFSEAMDPASINTSTFMLQQGANLVQGKVTYTGSMASFTPTNELLPNTVYIGTITTGAKDPQGNAMLANYVWKFTTGAGPDRTPPTVTSTDPVDASTAVAFNKKISVNFSEAMDTSSISTLSFLIKNTTLGGTAVAGSVAYTGTTAVFSPSGDLSPNTTYLGTLTTRAKDLAGNFLANNYTWNFTTGAVMDVTAPTVVLTDPANLAIGVAFNKKINAAFSEAMDPATITTTTFTLKQGATSVAGVINYTGTMATFTPAANLMPNSIYTGTITKGAKDLAGNALAQDYIWSFTTGTAPDIIAPTVISTDPGNASTGVALNKKVSASFSEAMDPLTITTTNFTLQTGTTMIAGTVLYAGPTATAVFSPTDNLVAGTTYTATITTGAKDLAGNAIASNYVWTFSTPAPPDVIPPTVVSTDPVNLAIGVLPNKIITATFSEAMDALSITGSSFVLKSGAATVSGTVTYSGMVATFSPSSNLSPNTTYTGTITTGAKDASGNALEVPYIWTFTTVGAPDIIPPIVVSTDPINNSIGVLLDKNITATFSEPMNPSTINATTFLLSQGATAVFGIVTYIGTTATFSPAANLLANTVYTATIKTQAKDIDGNSITNDYVWSFTTMQLPPSLGTAAIFGAFGGSAGITNQGLFTIINNGSIGTTGASTLITGFHDGTTADVYTETPLNKGTVTGRIYTAPPAPGTAVSFLVAQLGLADAMSAYNSISPAMKPGGSDPGAGELGGLTLAPGVYKSASGTFDITNGDLTLDAKGDPNAVWIFQTNAGLTVGVPGPAGARSVKMIGGGQAKNVFWYVGSAATINGAGGGIMSGNIIASAGVTFSTAGNVVLTVLNGRAISLNASVTMVNTVINVP